MPVDEKYLKQKAEQKRYQDRMDEMRRASGAKTQASLDSQLGDITAYGSKFDQAIEHYMKVVKDRRQQLGSESFSILIIQMRPTLVAFANACRELQMQVLCYACYKMSENLNYRDFSLLALTAESARNLRIMGDKYLNTEGHFSEPLPPVFVPYLAEIDEKGVLALDVTLPEPKTAAELQSTEEFKTAVKTSIRHWISTVTDHAGQPLYELVATPEGEKIRILEPALAPGGAAVDRFMSKEEFRVLRNHTLENELTNEFDLDFKPEALANAAPRP